MLELPKLWLGPWKIQGELSYRFILDPIDHSFLGVARQRSQASSVWFGYLNRPVIEVHEGEDESLVFTVSRMWGLGTGWQVCDADGQRTGTLRAELIRDRLGCNLAVIELSQEAGEGRWLNPGSEELARFAPSSDGQLISFGTHVEANPIFKMLLLASLLRSS